MKRKKILLSAFLIALFAIFSLNSCSDSYLNLTDPNKESSQTYWKTEAQMNEGLNAAYAMWRRPGLFSRYFHVMMILRSDEGWSESPDPTWIAYSDFMIGSYNSDTTEGIVLPWEAVYNQLYYDNQVIDNMNDHGYSIMTKDNADKILGQAYFVRGVAYWFLAGTYGRGPIQTSSTQDGPIGEQVDLYLQALKDLEAAEPLLPKTWTGDDEGRPTEGGAMGMEAKVMMQLAGYYKRSVDEDGGADLTKANDYWAQAKSKIEDIYGLGLYSLVPKWIDNFTEFNENNSESLFEINFRDGTYDGAETGMHRPKFFGLYLSTGDGSWNDASACDWLLDEFDKGTQTDGTEDIRKHYTLFFANDPIDPDQKFYTNSTSLKGGGTYTEWKAGGYMGDHKAYWRKYTSVDDDNKSEDYSSGVNFRVCRLADIYMMYSECINELLNAGATCNKTRADAIEYINKVRRRVNMADLDVAQYNTYDEMKDLLRHERLVELCGEGVRWNDLDRWGDIHTQEGINKLAERDTDFKTYVLHKSHRWPIPNRELSLYPGLTQNNGY